MHLKRNHLRTKLLAPVLAAVVCIVLFQNCSQKFEANSVATASLGSLGNPVIDPASGQTVTPVLEFAYASSQNSNVNNVALSIGESFQIDPLLPGPDYYVTSYAVTPALPAGLGINPQTGVISGTPTAAVAETTYEVLATTNKGVAVVGLNLSVQAAPAPLAYPNTNITIYGGISNNIYPSNYQLTAVSPNLKFSALTSLPPGLNIDTDTGCIYGTPTQAFTNLSTIIQLDNGFEAAQVTLDFTYVSAVTNLSFPVTSVSTPVNKPLSILYAYLPPGVQAVNTSWTLSPTTANLILFYSNYITISSQTPIPSTNYTISVQGSDGKTYTGTLNITVTGAPPAITVSSAQIMANLGTSVGWTAQATVSGAPVIIPAGGNGPPTSGSTPVTGPVTFTLTPATLPAGLIFDSTFGDIYGTPTATMAETNYTVTATNTTGSASANFTLQVNGPAPSVTHP